MEILQYQRFYKIPEELGALLMYLPKAYWYLLQTKTIDQPKRCRVLTTGYYSGTGVNSKRVDLTPIVTKSCVKAGIVFSAYNDAKRGGIKGNKVKIYF
jgi:hypothetical protein